MSPDLISLLSIIPEQVRAHDAGRVVQQIAQRLLRDEFLAIDLMETIGAEAHDEATDELLVTQLTSVLDEARMLRENGRSVGSDFIEMMQEHLAMLNAENALKHFGRFRLASCWTGAGLETPDCLALSSDWVAAPAAGDLGVLKDGVPDLEVDLDKLIDALPVDVEGDLQSLREALSHVLATIPREFRREFARMVVGRPKATYEDLGCTWIFDQQAEIRQGAVDGLSDRMMAGLASHTLIKRLASIRSWIADKEEQARIDGLIRDAKRRGIGGAQVKAAPKVHRVLASMVDGSGAQSLTIALQSGSARKMAIVLLKQGFGIKDAYVVPCSSASEQRRLIEMLIAQVPAWDVPLEYVKQAISIGLEDGLKAQRYPAVGLIDVAHALEFADVRPHSSSVQETIALMDPDGEIIKLSPQEKGRLINASKYWANIYPMIVETWFEDSDAMTNAIVTSATPTALKKALWYNLEDRRDHWANLIARSALLLHSTGAPEAKQFAAVALSLSEGRPLKKIPIMEWIADLSLEVCEYEIVADFGSTHVSDMSSSNITSRLPPKNLPTLNPKPEKPGELAKLLQAAGQTEWWIDGYMVGVCIAPKFVSPPSWISVLITILGPAMQDEVKLQRLFDLLMLRYMSTLKDLQKSMDFVIFPEDRHLLGIWSDGLLAAWDGNLDFWPKAKLNEEDKVARELLENMAEWKNDTNNFSESIPKWLQKRISAQAGMDYYI